VERRKGGKAERRRGGKVEPEVERHEGRKGKRGKATQGEGGKKKKLPVGLLSITSFSSQHTCPALKFCFISSLVSPKKY
jgi:hypothetical protein